MKYSIKEKCLKFTNKEMKECYKNIAKAIYPILKNYYDVISSNQLLFEIRNQLLSDNYKNKLKEEIRESKKIIQELEGIFEN